MRLRNLLFSVSLIASTIMIALPRVPVLCQYWIDSDIDNAVNVKVDGIEFEIETDTYKDLTLGGHYLFYRMMNAEGKWGTPAKYPFFLQWDFNNLGFNRDIKPTLCEYWIDEDRDNAVRVAVDGYNFEIDTESYKDLTLGGHYLSYRMMNAEGKWGTTAKYPFFLQWDFSNLGFYRDTKPVLCEYWIDEDRDNAVRVAVDGYNFEINTNAYSDIKLGQHYLAYRMMNADGKWGAPMTYSFFLPWEFYPEGYQESREAVGCKHFINGNFVGYGSINKTTDGIEAEVNLNQHLEIMDVTEIKFSTSGDDIINAALKGNAEYSFQMLSTNKKGGAPSCYDIELENKATEIAQSVAFPSKTSFSNLNGSGFKAISFTPTQSDFFIKGTNNCKVDFYKAISPLEDNPSASAQILSSGSVASVKGLDANTPYYAFIYDFNDIAAQGRNIDVMLMSEEGKAPAPTIEYDSSKMLVTIECADKSATLLYTTDFSDPTHDNGKPTGKTMLYTEPIKVDGNMTIKAMAWVDGVGNSTITTRSVSDLAVANPVLAYSSELSKFIFKTEEGSTTYYTTDKTSPKTSETRIEYTDDGFMPPVGCEIIFAYSSRKNWNDSEIVSFKNPWDTFSTPTPSIVENKEKNTVSFTCTEGGEVYYRTYVGDTTPGDYIKYGKEFTVTGNTHIDAYAVKNGCINSDVCSWYIDWVKADAPKMAYADNKVTLSSDVPEHVFRYSFDKDTALDAYRMLEGSNVIDMTGEDIVMAYVTAVGYQPSDVVTLSRSGEPILVEDKENNTISFTLRDGEEVYFRTYVGEETPGEFEKYSEPVTVVGNTYVEAYSVSGDAVESGVVKWYIDWVKADAPKMEYADNKVTLTSDVPGHVFRYSFDETAAIDRYVELKDTDVIEIGDNDHISAYVTAIGYQRSNVVSMTRVAVPVIVEDKANNMISFDIQNGEEIHFRTSVGDIASGDFARFTTPVAVTGNTHVEAYATLDGHMDSKTASWYIDWVKADAPTMEYADNKVTLSSDVPGHVFRYSFDKDAALEAYRTLEGSNVIDMTGEDIVMAYVTAVGYQPSDVVTLSRSGEPILVEDKENNTISFNLRDGEEVYFRTYVGEETPGEFEKYSAPVAVVGNTYVEAYSVSGDDVESGIVKWYIDWVKADAPKMAYADNKVTLTSDVPGHVFRYSFDETAAIDRYVELSDSDVIEIGDNDHISAYVTATGYQRSDVVSMTRVAEPVIVEDKANNIISFDIQNGESVLFHTYVGDIASGDFARFTAPVAVTGNTHVEAYATLDGHMDSKTASWYIDWVKADAPTMAYADNHVTLTSDVPGHVFYYTFDKPASLEEYDVLEEGNVIDMGDEDMIHVYVSATGYQPSDIVSFDKTTRNLSAPTLTYNDGFVTISDGGNDCELLYAVYAAGEEGVDGFMPYEEAVPVAYNMNVKAYAHKAGWNDSPVATLSHTEAPAISVTDLMVSIDGANDGAEVRYTTDGSQPDMSSAIFSTPFRLDQNCTIRAAAFEDGLIPAEGTPYEFTYAKCEAPALDADGYDGRHVTISWDDLDATATYVLKGETFNAVNGQQIDMEGLNTITAKTSKQGCDDSETVDFTARFYSDETDIFTTEAGQVADALAWRNNRDAAELTLHGPADAADFTTLKEFRDLTVLDLTDVNDESLPEEAFIGMAKLRHLTMPSALKSNSGTIFGENGNLRSVSFTGLEQTMPAGLLDGINNPNLLLYTRTPNYALSVSESFPNAVYVDYAANIVVSDGYPFECPKEFTAVHASYTKDFTKRTRLGECSGWEAVVLPFSATEYRHADKGEILPFASDRTDSDLRFWLFRRGDNEWKREETMVADTPYLVSMPNSDGYDPAYNLNGPVTFSSSNVTIPVTDLSDKGMDIHGSDLIVPTYEFAPMTEWMQAVNDIDREIDRVPYLEGGAYVGFAQGQTRDIRPFEWYIRTSSPNRAPRPIFDSSEVASLFAENAIEVWTEGDDLLILSGRDRDIRIIDLAGQLVRRIKVKAGEIHRESALTPGVYFAADRKILIK